MRHSLHSPIVRLALGAALLPGLGCQQRADDKAVATVTAAKGAKAHAAAPSVASAVAEAAKAAPVGTTDAPPLPPGHGDKLPPGHPPVAGVGHSRQVPAKGAALPGKQGPTGRVAEVLQAGRYTYLRIGAAWSAVPMAKVSVGQQVSIVGAMEMKNFKSKATGRTFPSVWFGHLAVPKADAAAQGAAAQGAAAQGAGAARPGAKAAAKPGPPVAKATGEGARTVAEVHAASATLGGKLVRIRGRVVKFNADILQRHWLHLQDGSGDAEKGSHDLTVTLPDSADKVAVGQVVTVEGTVALNRDFGAGYAYPVLVEKARVLP